MTRLVRAELLRAVSGRWLATLAVITLALNALSILGTGATQVKAIKGASTTLTDASHELLRLGFGALLFATLAGAVLATAEFRHGSIGRSAYLAGRPERLMGAKVLASLCSGAFFGLLGVLSASVTSWLYLSSRGYNLVLDRESVLILIGVFAVCVLAAPWGVLIGWIVRAQLPTLIGIMAWTLIAETAVIELVPGVGKFLPGGAQASIYRDVTVGHPVATPWGYVLFLAWLALAALIAVGLLRRRDLA